MKSVTRVEIIIDAHHIPQVVRTLAKTGVRHYSVFPQVYGRGDRGDRSGEELTGTFTNAMLLTICDPADTPRVEEAVRPLLKQLGGICLFTESRELEH
jgi:nitrogen regulatory protein PII